MYYCYYTYNIIIIHICSCPIATESPSFPISQLIMSAAAQAYFNLGISTATRKAYTAGLWKYNTFCRKINQLPIPVCEDTLLLFVTNLAQQDLPYATIQVYLSAVRYIHTTTSESTTLKTPRLNYVLKGIRKTCAMNHQPREWQPITFQIMEHLHMVLSKHPGITKTSQSGWPTVLNTLDSSELVNSPHHSQTTLNLLLTYYYQM